MRRTNGIKRLVAVALTVVALVLATVSVAFAGSSSERPFKEHLSGYTYAIDYGGEDRLFNGKCSVESDWMTFMSGTGTVSHMGTVSWTSEHCFQMNGFTFGDSNLVITAANGDQLFATYSGWMTGATAFSENMVIEGGTGRFVGAEGLAFESGWFDPDTGYMEIVGDGVIQYDASMRSND